MIKNVFLILIRAYQYTMSPLLGPSCRFYPTCSEYAHNAIVRHGLPRGMILFAKRFFKCHPLHPGGFDPVP